MLNINSINKGIVIDHIKPGYGIKIFNYLNLDLVDYTVALIINASSKKHGKKDMIKIENTIDVDLTILGYFDPNITVNIIDNERIKEKIILTLPNEVVNLINCNNPRCITSVEREIPQKFSLVNRDKAEYKCNYCDHLYSKD